MVREFKIRRTPFKVWLGVIIVIVAIVLMALHTENYWNLSPIVLPVLLLIDEQMTRILVQENGDIWLKGDLAGVSRHTVSCGLYCGKRFFVERPGDGVLYQRIP